MDQLVTYIQLKNPDILLLSESRTTDNVLDFELNVENYNLVRCDSNSRHTGGVLIYVHKSLKYEVDLNTSLNNTYWCVILHTVIKNNQFYIGVCYRSPNSNVDVFMDVVDEWCETYKNKNLSLQVILTLIT